VNDLHVISTAVVEAARDSLVIQATELGAEPVGQFPGERLVGFPFRFDFFHVLVLLACFSCLIDCVSLSFDGARVEASPKPLGLCCFLRREARVMIEMSVVHPFSWVGNLGR
jgi:hypothetical protein